MRIALVVCVLATFGFGCAATRQARDVQESGFIPDYSLLQEGPEGGAQRLYQKPGATWSQYDKILLDPITLWVGAESGIGELPKSDRQMLADRLYSVFYTRLDKDYEMVQSPAPGALRLSLALTGAEQSSPVLDTISTVLPQALILSGLKKGLTGRPAFVGAARAELKMTDATTGELLAAAVDARVGAKNLSGVATSWDDVDQAFVYWAERAAYKLCTDSGRSGCVAPSQ